MPAVTKRGPQSQPNWHCCLRMTVQPADRIVDLARAGARCGASGCTPSRCRSGSRSSFRPGRRSDFTSQRWPMNMFSVRATSRPLSRTVATVSSPSATSSTTSSASSDFGTMNVARYSQSRSSIHCRPSSFVPQNGSGISPCRQQIAVHAARHDRRAPRRAARGVAETPRRRGEGKHAHDGRPGSAALFLQRVVLDELDDFVARRRSTAP